MLLCVFSRLLITAAGQLRMRQMFLCAVCAMASMVGSTNAATVKNAKRTGAVSTAARDTAVPHDVQ
jgi:hypothetical protein